MVRPPGSTEVHWITQARAGMESLGKQQTTLPRSGRDQRSHEVACVCSRVPGEPVGHEWQVENLQNDPTLCALVSGVYVWPLREPCLVTAMRPLGWTIFDPKFQTEPATGRSSLG